MWICLWSTYWRGSSPDALPYTGTEITFSVLCIYDFATQIRDGNHIRCDGMMASAMYGVISLYFSSVDGSEYNLRHPRTRRRTLYAVKWINHVNCVCGQSSLIRRLGKIKKDCLKQSNVRVNLVVLDSYDRSKCWGPFIIGNPREFEGNHLKADQIIEKYFSICRLRMKDNLSRFLFVREGRNKDWKKPREDHLVATVYISYASTFNNNYYN